MVDPSGSGRIDAVVLPAMAKAGRRQLLPVGQRVRKLPSRAMRWALVEAGGPRRDIIDVRVQEPDRLDQNALASRFGTSSRVRARSGSPSHSRLVRLPTIRLPGSMTE